MTPSTPPLRRAKPALGTIVTLSVADGPHALHASEEAFRELFRLERIFNRFDDESELAALNRAAPGTPFSVGSELAELLALSAHLAAQTRGAFWVGAFRIDGRTCWREDSPLDLGGIAKGFIVDKVYERLARENGAVGVNAGGDLRVRGGTHVEVRAPGDRRYRIELTDGALATSLVGGDVSVGEPRARYTQASRYAGASAVAATCTIADAATKVALFGEWGAWRDLPGWHSLCLFDERGAVVHREG